MAHVLSAIAHTCCHLYNDTFYIQHYVWLSWLWWLDVIIPSGEKLNLIGNNSVGTVGLDMPVVHVHLQHRHIVTCVATRTDVLI